MGTPPGWDASPQQVTPASTIPYSKVERAAAAAAAVAVAAAATKEKTAASRTA